MSFPRIHTASGHAPQMTSAGTLELPSKKVIDPREHGDSQSASALYSQERSEGLGSTICDYISSFLNAICNCLAKIPCLGCFFTHSEIEVEPLSEIEVGQMSETEQEEMSETEREQMLERLGIENPASRQAKIEDESLKLMWNAICTQYGAQINRGVLDREMPVGDIRTLLKGNPEWIQQIKQINLNGRPERQLETLPPEISLFTSLEYLELDENRLTMLPPGITQLKSLLRLGFSNNRLGNFPPVITQLTSLRQLDLFGNFLTKLHPGITQLTSLEVLDISSNQLINFPHQITQLTSLKELDLSANFLTKLHPDITKLSSLEKLNLALNSFPVFPPEIEGLTSLTTLRLTRNPLPGKVPPEIRLPKSLINIFT